MLQLCLIEAKENAMSSKLPNNIALFYPLLLHNPMYACTFRENRIEFHQRVLRGQGGKEVSYYVDGGLVGGVGVGAKEGGSRTRVDDGMGGAF